MRVALVVDDFPSTSQTFIVDKVVGLLGRGIDVHVVCWRLDRAAWEGYPELSGRPGMVERVHACSGARRKRALVLGTDLARASATPRTLSRFLGARRRARRGRSGLGLEARILAVRPDVVHFEFGWLARAHALLADGLDVPVTASFRGADLNYFGLDEERYYEPVWSGLAAIHCLGDDLWARAKRRGCPSSMPHVLIPPAVDVDIFRPPSARLRMRMPGDPFRVLTVARLHWKKGLEHGLEAVRRLRVGGVDVRYRIVGSGPHLPAVRACVADLGLEAGVELLGSRSRRQVRDELATADVLLHPATSEGFGNAVLEAQAMELPIVATDADGLPANVRHGVTGYVVPRRASGALADALATIAADPGLGRVLGEAGRLHVAAQFRPADQITAFLAFYRAVADHHRARQPSRSLSSAPAPRAG